ncbi:MAG: hotdog fold domain-containing protein [Myxococcota bacterium]
MPNFIKQTYDRLQKIPLGKQMFSKFVGFAAPYSSSISPSVEELRPGYARISMKDKKRLRNHLKSIHAVSMMNLGELATGLAINYSLPDNARGILKNLSMDYLKKGRGTLTAECTCAVPATNEKAEYKVLAEIRDVKKEIVAKAEATWLVGPESR